MINIVSRMCDVCEDVRPSFGFPDDPRPTHCVRCKDDGMVNIVSRMCDVCEVVVANSGFPGDACPTRCAGCRDDGMVNLVSPRCGHADCDILATCPGVDGSLNKLCAKHGYEAGTVAEYNPRASKAACRAQCALAAEGLAFEHEHLNMSTMPPRWEGREVEGLVPGRRHRPDGVLRRDGAVATVFFYHGNLFHGYPPGHKRYNTEQALPQRAADGHQHIVNTKLQYESTMAAMELFRAQGYKVCYLWEHEDKAARRAKTPLLDVVRWLEE